MLSDLASMATAVGVLAAFVQLLLSRRQARAGFEQEFVRRYWEIGDDSLRGDLPEADVQRKRYRRLCEDEFEVMRLGSVSWRTWEVWHDAIRQECLPHRHEVGDLDWLSTCLERSDNHRGASCPALFEPGLGEHSGHLSARLPFSPSRALFMVSTAMRKVLYKRWGVGSAA